MKRHLFVAISSHGYGHLAQVAAVINALWRGQPGLKLTLQGDFPTELLAGRIEPEFHHLRESTDVGIAMLGPTEVNWSETVAGHRRFHENWNQRLEAQMALFEQCRPDLVLADVPYLPLAATHQLAIPSVALCSLNWVDIIVENPHAAQALEPELQVMRSAYSAASKFIQPAPSLPMAWLPNRHAVGPIVAEVSDQRTEIFDYCGLSKSDRIVVVSLGGLPMSERILSWPKIANVRWFTDVVQATKRQDVVDTKNLPWSFHDLLCSADVVIAKPGYGMFTEAGCWGIPVLNITREGWAETPWLLSWLEQHVPVESISHQQLLAGDYEQPVKRLLEQGRQASTSATGAANTAEVLSRMLIRKVDRVASQLPARDS